MLYILAAWTGYRRRELASLTLRSFDLESANPVVRVQAAYAKNKRADEIALHAYVVERFMEWLSGKNLSAVDSLFALVTEKGHYRKTSKMMRVDLGRAREAWIEEANDRPDEVARRKESDFLSYKDADGLFADFHANRHTFISNLSRAGVPWRLLRNSPGILTRDLRRIGTPTLDSMRKRRQSAR